MHRRIHLILRLLIILIPLMIVVRRNRRLWSRRFSIYYYVSLIITERCTSTSFAERVIFHLLFEFFSFFFKFFLFFSPFFLLFFSNLILYLHQILLLLPFFTINLISAWNAYWLIAWILLLLLECILLMWGIVWVRVRLIGMILRGSQVIITYLAKRRVWKLLLGLYKVSLKL